MNILNRNWSKIFLVASLVILALNIAGLVVDIIGIITIIGINVINIYCTFFSFLTFSAEIRQFSLFRRFVSVWLKYFTFLLFYKSRGVFYMMYGLLLIGNGVLTTVSGFIALALGFVMIIVSIFVDLPVFGDMKEAEASYEEKVNEYVVEQPVSHANDVSAVPAAETESAAGATPPSKKKKGNEKEEEQVLAGGWRPPRIVEEPVPEERTSPAPPSNAFNLRPADFITAEEEAEDQQVGYNNFGIIGPSAFGSRGSINNKESPQRDV